MTQHDVMITCFSRVVWNGYRCLWNVLCHIILFWWLHFFPVHWLLFSRHKLNLRVFSKDWKVESCQYDLAIYWYYIVFWIWDCIDKILDIVISWYGVGVVFSWFLKSVSPSVCILCLYQLSHYIHITDGYLQSPFVIALKLLLIHVLKLLHTAPLSSFAWDIMRLLTCF